MEPRSMFASPKSSAIRFNLWRYGGNIASPVCKSTEAQHLLESLLAKSLSSDILLAARAAATGPPVFAQPIQSAHGG